MLKRIAPTPRPTWHRARQKRRGGRTERHDEVNAQVDNAVAQVDDSFPAMPVES